MPVIVGDREDEWSDWEITGGDTIDLDRAFGGAGANAYNEPNIAKWNYNGPFKGCLLDTGGRGIRGLK